MESNKEALRRKIFDTYSKNWSDTRKFLSDLSLGQEYDKALLCPVCTKVFNEDGLSQNYSDSLTLEDIPPKRLGGKPLILTCKECNNFSGTKLDSKLFKQRHVNSFLKGDANSNVDVRVTIGDKLKTAAVLNIDKEKNLFSFKVKEDQTKRIGDYLTDLSRESSCEGTPINFTFQEPSRRLSGLAQLRIAYLIAFYKLGYGFILDKTYKLIREQIRNPEKEILPSFGILDPVGVSHDGLMIVTEPKEFRSILVYRLKLKNKTERRGVLIPGPSEDTLQFYEKTKELSSYVNFQYTPIDVDINFINTYGDPFIPFKIWHKFKDGFVD